MTWKHIHDAFKSGQGSALNSERAANRAVKVYAKSRLLYVAHNQAQRVKNLWLPLKMPFDLVERWEEILNLPGTGSKVARRKAIAEHFDEFRMISTHQKLNDMCNAFAPGIFDGLYYTTPEFAANTGYATTIPGGLDGYSFDIAPGVWRSAVYHITIMMDQPEYMDDGEFMELGNALLQKIDGKFPAYVTFNWARSEFGFILDNDDGDLEGASQLDFDAFGEEEITDPYELPGGGGIEE